MIKFLRDWKYYILSGLGIILLAVFLRTYNLNELPVFGDEAIYIRWAQIMRNEPTLRFIPLSDGKQPLFMWVVIPFQKLFSDPLIAGRTVSLVTGLVTMIGLFLMTVIVFGLNVDKKLSFIENLKNTFRTKIYIKVGLISSLIYAISPYTVFFDRMALVDSMLTMFGVWTFIFSFLAFKFLRLDAAMLAGASLGGAYLTKSPALFFLLVLPSNLILVKWPKEDKQKLNRFFKLSLLTLITVGIALTMFNLLRLGPNFYQLSRRNLDYVHPITRIFQYPFDPMYVFLKKIVGYFWYLGPSSIILLYVISLLTRFKGDYKRYLVLLIWSIVPIVVVSEFSKTMTARYILFTVPYFFIISATGFLSKSENIKRLITIGLILFVVQSIYINRLILTDINAASLPQGERAGYLEEWTSGTGIKETAEYLKEYRDNNPSENIVIGTEGYFGTLPDALQAYLYDYPDITVIGVGTLIKQLPKDLFESKMYGNKTFFLINNSRLIKDYNKLGLEVVKEYPKALRAEWTNEYKSLGPREILYLFEVTEDSVKVYENAIKNERNKIIE